MIEDNEAGGCGGITGSYMVLKNSIIRNNHATGNEVGGGDFRDSDLINVLVEGNRGYTTGGLRLRGDNSAINLTTSNNIPNLSQPDHHTHPTFIPHFSETHSNFIPILLGIQPAILPT